MGHQLLPHLPDTVPWRRVVAAVAEGEGVPLVAASTTQAAARGLEVAKGDEGLAYSFWLLAQVALAARQPDFAGSLREVGLKSAADPDLFDLAGAFTDAVDRRLQTTGRRTDVGEMAQLAAVQSLTSLVGSRSANLFGVTPQEVRGAARELSTQRGFASLAHDFFARFANRFLVYHLGRELSAHVGGCGRFADAAQHQEFLEGLDAHCREAALIVRDYAGAWYSKAQFEGGISPAKARRFTDHALKKLAAELRRRGAAHG